MPSGGWYGQFTTRGQHLSWGTSNEPTELNVTNSALAVDRPVRNPANANAR